MRGLTGGLLAAGIALTGAGTAAAADDRKAPTGTTATSGPAPQVRIAVDDGKTSARGGERLDYSITVTNLGATRLEDLLVTLAVPAGVTLLSSSPAATGDGGHQWQVSVDTAEPTVVTASVRLPAELPAGLLRMAATACLRTSPSAAPVVCASDSDLLPAGEAAPDQPSSTAGPVEPAGMAVPWVAVAGFTVAAVIGVALLARRRVRNRQLPGK